MSDDRPPEPLEDPEFPLEHAFRLLDDVDEGKRPEGDLFQHYVPVVRQDINHAAALVYLDAYDQLEKILDPYEEKDKAFVQSIYRVVHLLDSARALMSNENNFARLTDLDNRLKAYARREPRTDTQNMRKRHAQARPFVKALDDKYVHYSAVSKRAAAMAPELMQKTEFETLFLDLKDPRYPRKDMEVILTELDKEREAERDLWREWRERDAHGVWRMRTGRLDWTGG